MVRQRQFVSGRVALRVCDSYGIRIIKRLVVIWAMAVWFHPASAGYVTAYTATFLDRGGFSTAEACSGTDCAGFGNVLGIDPFISFSNSQITASADLRDGALRFSAGDRSSVNVRYADELTFSIPGLGAGDRATITFDIRVDGTYARSSDQDIGQASFSFSASSGQGRIDVVTGAAGYRTLSGSDVVNSTAAPEVFEPFSSFGDWQQIATNLFRASIDVLGSDPTISFAMSMSASGPADFSHTGDLRLQLPAGATFVSASGAFLNAVGPTGNSVPEPASLTLVAVAIALLILRQTCHA